MKSHIFFLVCVIGFSSAVVTVSSNGSVQEIYGDVNYYRGDTFSIQNNFDGSVTKTLGLSSYINDGNSFVPFIADGTAIQTNHGSVELVDDIFTFFPSGVIQEPIYDEDGLVVGYFRNDPKFSDSIVGKYADISDLTSWTYPNALNLATPITSWDGSILQTEKEKAGIGNLKYRYIQNDGKWKTELEVTNLSGLTTKVFGFDQIIDINSDTIKFGGVVRNLDNFDGQSFDKQFLDNNEGKVLDLMNGNYFDFDIAYDNLYQVTVYDTGIGKSQLVFDFRMSEVLLPNETLILDPTFGDLTETIFWSAESEVNTVDCTVPTSNGKYSTGADVFMEPTGTSQYCTRALFSFDVSNFPDNLVVTQINFTNTVSNVDGHRNTEIYEVDPAITTLATDDDYWIVAGNGTQYLSSFADYSTNGAHTVTLNSNAHTGFESDVVGDEVFEFGVKFVSETRDGARHWVRLNDPQFITVTYNLTPDQPKQFAGTIDEQEIDFSWAEGDRNGGTGVSFQLERHDGTDWVQQVSQVGTTWTDSSPIDNGTASYRIFQSNSLGQSSCYQYILPSDLTDNLVSHLPLCYTLNDNGLLDMDVFMDPTYCTDCNELYSNNTAGDIGFDFDQTTLFYLNNSNALIPNIVSDDYTFIFDYARSSEGEDLFKEQIATTGGNCQSGSGANNWCFEVGGSANIYMYIHDVSSNDLLVATDSSTTSVTGAFTQYAFSHNSATNSLQQYVNGTTSGVAGDTSTLVGGYTSTEDLHFGAETDLGRSIGGQLRNFMIFNATLTDDQIENIYKERFDTTFQPPPLTTLTATVIDFDTVKLTLTDPASARAITGYDINYTTPLGDPTTILLSAQTPAGTYTIDGLDTYSNEYSFRLGTITAVGTNATGTIANATIYAPFTIGELDVSPDNDNEDRVELAFTETVVSPTQSTLKVQYLSSYDLNCDLDYKFARTNQTYSSLAETVEVSAPYDVSHTFTINNATNEIIDVYCWDTADVTIDGKYRMNQAVMPLVTQANNFSAGLNGTSGEFGAIDFITVIAVIVAMIGFNRYNPAVGVAIMATMVGAMAYFGIIETPTLVIGMVALVVVIAIIKVRGNN